VKKAIEYLNKKERILAGLDTVLLDGDLEAALDERIIAAREYIEELTTPRWEAPEQWEKRTGKPWPDDWAVYVSTESGWSVRLYKFTRCEFYRDDKTEFVPIIICATEAGPPPDEWRPKENQ
jgi:hypothetical protein